MMRNPFAVAPCLLLLAAMTTTVTAGDPAVWNPAEVDSNYHFIGEYMGQWNGQSVGVQVSTRQADAPYYAKLFVGGLPGIGWNGEAPRHFSGKLAGSRLRLIDDQAADTQMEVMDNLLTLTKRDARSELKKVARRSVAQGLTPPAGAKILFDGTSTSAFKEAKMTEDGLLKAGAETVDPISSCRLHLEFRTPYMPHSVDQKRGNSGVYIQRRYEVQILESFGQDCVFNGCAALYRQRPPNLNMSLPPLVWQTYDIFFTAAKFDAAGQKVAPAQISVIHNGVPVHYRTVITAKTGAGKPEGPEPLPLLLQDHSDPVVFRNVWMQPADVGMLTYSSDAALSEPQYMSLPATVGLSSLFEPRLY
jgi:Domain of Unknown Function (DUF1080)